MNYYLVNTKKNLQNLEKNISRKQFDECSSKAYAALIKEAYFVHKSINTLQKRVFSRQKKESFDK